MQLLVAQFYQTLWGLLKNNIYYIYGLFLYKTKVFQVCDGATFATLQHWLYFKCLYWNLNLFICDFRQESDGRRPLTSVTDDQEDLNT